jgi:hypothetical protein
VLLDATGQLVQRQAEVWARALTENERRLNEASARQQEQMAGALEAAIKGTLQTHSQLLATMEKQAIEQSARLFEQLGTLSSVVRDYGNDQHAALMRAGESLAAQVAALGGLQQGEQHLLQLQAGLQQNLAALAGAGTFEQAVHSLTAAIHLLTARTSALPQTAAPPHPRIASGKAA